MSEEIIDDDEVVIEESDNVEAAIEESDDDEVIIEGSDDVDDELINGVNEEVATRIDEKLNEALAEAYSAKDFFGDGTVSDEVIDKMIDDIIDRTLDDIVDKVIEEAQDNEEEEYAEEETLESIENIETTEAFNSINENIGYATYDIQHDFTRSESVILSPILMRLTVQTCFDMLEHINVFTVTKKDDVRTFFDEIKCDMSLSADTIKHALRTRFQKPGQIKDFLDAKQMAYTCASSLECTRIQPAEEEPASGFFGFNLGLNLFQKPTGSYGVQVMPHESQQFTEGNEFFNTHATRELD